MTEEEHDKPEIDGWAFRDSTDGLQVLVYCHHDDWDIKKEFDVSLSIENIPDQGPVSVMHYRIDSEHSNGYPEWERCGKPDWPDETQRKKILARSGLELLQAPEVYEPHTGRLEITFPLPIHSISLLEIRFLSKPEKPEQISDGIQSEQ